MTGSVLSSSSALSISSCVLPGPQNGYNRLFLSEEEAQGVLDINNAILRRAFSTLTSNFLYPFRKYWGSATFSGYALASKFIQTLPLDLGCQEFVDAVDSLSE